MSERKKTVDTFQFYQEPNGTVRQKENFLSQIKTENKFILKTQLDVVAQKLSKSCLLFSMNTLNEDTVSFIKAQDFEENL